MSYNDLPIRKLSLEFSKDIYKDDVKRRLLPAKIILQGVCCWPDSDTARVKIVTCFLLFNLFIIEVFHVAYMFKHMYDIGDAVTTGATVATTMAGLLRLYIMITKRKVINNVLYTIWKQFWPLEVIKSKLRESLKLKATISLLLPSSFLIFSIISNSQIVGPPFIKNRSLVLNSLFPFQWDKMYIYEIIYVWQYYSDWYVLFMINAFDFLFVPLVTICAIQFNIMQEVFKHILTDESKVHREIIFGEKGKSIGYRDMLVACLEHHKLLIGICDDIEDSFNMAILIQFFISTGAICVACLVLKIDFSQFLKMLMFAGGHVTQLYYYCFAGQELLYQSSQLSDAIYECNWHLSYDREFRRALVLMIQRSQKVQNLTAAGITDLDYSSFLRIMRLSFSFYTLLNNLLAKTQ